MSQTGEDVLWKAFGGQAEAPFSRPSPGIPVPTLHLPGGDPDRVTIPLCISGSYKDRQPCPACLPD